jgi:hypothetical protein
MIKKILKLDGVQELSKGEQREVSAGSAARKCCEYGTICGIRYCKLWINGTICPV